MTMHAWMLRHYLELCFEIVYFAFFGLKTQYVFVLKGAFGSYTLSMSVGAVIYNAHLTV